MNNKYSEIKKINIEEKLELFSDYWNPRIIGELNGQHVKIVKFEGDFIWHKHDTEDELFYVIKGSFIMELRDKSIQMEEGDMIIIPSCVEHRPCAKTEVHVMVFEPGSTKNTGDKTDKLTKTRLERI